MRVTFCAYDKPDNVGGPVTWLLNLLPALRDRGIECHCLIFLHYGDSGPLLTGLRAKGIACTAVTAPYYSEDRVVWVLEQLQRIPTDVFVPNLVVAGYHAAKWVRAAGVATVGVLHSDDPFYRAVLEEFACGRPGERLSALVAVSEQLFTNAAARSPHGTVVSRIGCGVAIPALMPERDPAGLRIAYVGRLVEEQKRISDVTRAFCRVVAENPDTEAILFGDGPDRHAVEEIIRTEGADLPVRLGGLIPSDKVQDHLTEFDLIVLLSDYEGLPIALLEAMACGCVPVCLRTESGIPELIEDGVTGLIVDDRSDHFAAAIRKLRLDPMLRIRLAQAARARVQERFGVERTSALWADLLITLAPDRNSLRPIRAPRRLRLPQVHPDLASADVRRPLPSLPLRIYRRMRRQAGRVRRNIFGRG